MPAMPNDTKQKLIDTARAMIWQNSYGSVSVDHICKAADVKKGSFYHYFPSKADLAIASLEQDYAKWKPFYDEAFSASLSPVERFEQFADIIYRKQKEAVDKFGRACGCPYATLGCELAGQEEVINRKVEEIFESHKRYYEATLRDLIAQGCAPADMDVKAKAEEIYAYVTGQMVMARIHNTLDHLKRDMKSGIFRIIDVEYAKKETEAAE